VNKYEQPTRIHWSVYPPIIIEYLIYNARGKPKRRYIACNRKRKVRNVSIVRRRIKKSPSYKERGNKRGAILTLFVKGNAF
jgi:hypothetical protein